MRNWKLFAVITVSIAFQIFAAHNAIIGHWLKIAPLSIWTLLILLAVGTIPLFGLEVAKFYAARNRSDRYL